MKPHTLNQVAVWLPMKNDALDVKTYPNYQYMHKGIIQPATSLKPVVRYAKNYYDGDIKFSLCIISLEKNTKRMEAFLDKTAKEMDIMDVPADSSFHLTEVFYEGV